MPMNGGDWRSGPIPHGGTREEGMGVPTGAWATIFVTGGKPQENGKKKAEQQTSKKQRKQGGGKRDQTHTTEILIIVNQQAKRAEQKEVETHKIS